MFSVERIGRQKLQYPSSNIQRNFNNQVSKPTRGTFDVWRLEFLWSLDVGAWSFVPLRSVCFFRGANKRPIGFQRFLAGAKHLSNHHRPFLRRRSVEQQRRRQLRSRRSQRHLRSRRRLQGHRTKTRLDRSEERRVGKEWRS